MRGFLKQCGIYFDTEPKIGSNNAVTSDGIFRAIQEGGYDDTELRQLINGKLITVHGEGTTVVGYTRFGTIKLNAGNTMFLIFRKGVDNIVLFPTSGSEITISGTDHIVIIDVPTDSTYSVRGYSNTEGLVCSVDLVAIPLS